MNKNTFKPNLFIPIFFGLIFSFFSLNTVSALDSVSLVKDINPGTDSSTPQSFTNVNGSLYFWASDANGYELFKSDGTDAGTNIIHNIPAPIWSSVQSNGILYFNTYGGDPIYGNELWKTDGTAAGTKIVKDINPGTAGSGPSNLTNVNGILYFQATDGINGYELWKTDGTEVGTVMVKSVCPVSNDYRAPYGFTNINNVLYFIVGGSSTMNYELWRSDGTEVGTIMLFSGTANQSPSSFININGTIYFQANNALWKSDGTVSGTKVVKVVYNVFYLTNVNGILYFQASDGVHGIELWKSDGTAAGTVIVKDINPGSGDSSPIILTNINGVLYFRATDGIHGSELWKSDGTEAGTVMIKDINPGSGDSFSNNFISIKGNIYFQANDGINGMELWKTDGTQVGTQIVKDIYAGSAGSNPSSFININGTIYFRANDGVNGSELWKLVSYEPAYQNYDSVGNFTGSTKAVLGTYENPGYRYKKYEDTLYKYLENFHQLTGLMLKKFSK